jgi:exonuclease VII large subunit
MFDDLNNATENLYPSEQEQVTEQPQQTEQDSDFLSKQASIRVLRERADAAERRNRELESMIQQNMSQQKANKMQIDDSDDFDMSDDTYVEGKHLKKYVKTLKQELKNQRQQFEEFNQKNSVAQAEMRLKSQFNDFDSIVSRENLEKLSMKKPELYRSIISNPDLYDKGHAAYEMIKNSGILTNQYEDIDRRVEENKLKPRSASNAAPQSGDTPLSRAGDYDRRILTEERKAFLRKQSEEAARNYQ